MNMHIKDIFRNGGTRLRPGTAPLNILKSGKIPPVLSASGDYSEFLGSNRGLWHHTGDGSATMQGIRSSNFPSTILNNSTSSAANSATEPSMWSHLFKSNSKSPSLAWGMGMGALGATIGTSVYGSAKLMSPNNSSVEDPLKNIFRGALIGGLGAGAMMLSRNAIGQNFTKAVTKNSSSPWLNRIKDFAPSVESALNNNVTKGAIAAGLIAGSGNFDLTRPVNPVY